MLDLRVSSAGNVLSRKENTSLKNISRGDSFKFVDNYLATFHRILMILMILFDDFYTHTQNIQ